MKEVVVVMSLLIAGYLVVDRGTQWAGTLIEADGGMPLAADSRQATFNPDLSVTAEDTARYRKIMGIPEPRYPGSAMEMSVTKNLPNCACRVLVVTAKDGTPVLFDRGVRFR